MSELFNRINRFLLVPPHCFHLIILSRSASRFESSALFDQHGAVPRQEFSGDRNVHQKGELGIIARRDSRDTHLRVVPNSSKCPPNESGKEIVIRNVHRGFLEYLGVKRISKFSPQVMERRKLVASPGGIPRRPAQIEFAGRIQKRGY